MTTERANFWTLAAQKLSRTGLLWLALTVVALGSFASPGFGIATNARLVAASSVGTSKLKANSPAAPTVLPGELNRAVPHRAQAPDAAAKRTLAGGTPIAFIATEIDLSAPARPDRVASAAVAVTPAWSPRAFDARAPPRAA